MAQWGEVTCCGVPLSDPDLVVVRHVEQAGDHIAAQLPERLGLEHRGPRDDDRHHREQRRQQAARPAHPELPQRDAIRALPFGDQQQRDQVAGDHEEHLDAEEATGQPVAVGVVHHHRDHGERAHPVETRKVRDSTDVRGVLAFDGLTPGRGEGRHGGSSIAEDAVRTASSRRVPADRPTGDRRSGRVLQPAADQGGVVVLAVGLQVESVGVEQSPGHEPARPAQSSRNTLG